ELSQMLSETPPVWKGSSKLFRNLKERGVISYTEYLFLLCILTKPHAGFRIAFNMFDTDGNEMVDKKEFLVLQEIFRKKNEKRETKGDEEKRAMLVLKTDTEELVSRSYWDTLRRNTSQALFSDLAERADDITSLVADTTLLVHFFGKKGKAELNFEDFYRFMDNLQTEVLEIEFLSYSNGMNTISEEDFAHILLRYTNVENTSVFLENVRYSIPEEKGITFDEFRSFFQFLNNLEDFAIALNMYNFASRSIGQDEFKRAVYVATGLKFSPHLVNTVFKIFDVDKDDQLSYKEFIGIMKDRLHRGFRFPESFMYLIYLSLIHSRFISPGFLPSWKLQAFANPRSGVLNQSQVVLHRKVVSSVVSLDYSIRSIMTVEITVFSSQKMTLECDMDYSCCLMRNQYPEGVSMENIGEQVVLCTESGIRTPTDRNHFIQMVPVNMLFIRTKRATSINQS
ncbi:hypothetical protein STEG23_020264, partial [Scotinomys teguina]